MGHKSLALHIFLIKRTVRFVVFSICYWPETGVCMMAICRSFSIRSCWEVLPSEEEW